MAISLRIVAPFLIVPVIDGAFTCSGGFKDKANTPLCAGAESPTCSSATCCDVVPTCKDFSASWVGAQLLGNGCFTDKKFFDLKKLGVEVASPEGDAEVKAACCTSFANAKCSDWSTMSCPSGKKIVSSNNAPADGSNGISLTSAKFREMCCIPRTSTCSDFSGGWLALQLLGQGCALDTKFFDTKKSAVGVSAPAEAAEVKAACCTPFANAKCSDWGKLCPLGKNIVSSNNAPADGTNGKTLTTAKFRERCCVEPPEPISTCSDFSVAWIISQGIGQGCALDTKFFDTKKLAVSVSAPRQADQVKAACCTPFTDAKCSDWNLMSCPTGKFLASMVSAPGEGDNGMQLSSTKFREMCCTSPMKCADFTMEDDIDSATSSSFAAWAVLLLLLRVVIS